MHGYRAHSSEQCGSCRRRRKKGKGKDWGKKRGRRREKSITENQNRNRKTMDNSCVGVWGLIFKLAILAL